MLETLDRPGQIARLLAVKEDTGYAVDDRLNGSSGAIGDGRPACGCEFERCHTKVLFAREDKGAVAGRVVPDLVVGKATQELNGRPGLGYQAVAIRPISNNQQPPPQ